MWNGQDIVLLRSTFILNEFLVSLKVSQYCCLCTPELACNQGSGLQLKMRPRSHHLCWLLDFLCSPNPAWQILEDGPAACASQWIIRGVAGGGRMQGNQFGSWARALWLAFRVLTDRQTDRWSLFELLLFLSVSVQLLRSLGPRMLSCPVQSFLSVCVWCRQCTLNCLWLYCSNKKGAQRRQQLCHEAVPHPGI